MLWDISAILKLLPPCWKGAGIPEVHYLILWPQVAQVFCGMRYISVGKWIFPSKTTVDGDNHIVDSYIWPSCIYNC